MDREEIIQRLKNIAEHVVCRVGEWPFVMSLDDGIALHEAIDMLNRGPEIVTCKDCIHRPEFSEDYDPDEKGNAMEIIFPDFDFRCPCRCDDPWYNRMPDDDWFCGNGERRKEENDDGE